VELLPEMNKNCVGEPRAVNISTSSNKQFDGIETTRVASPLKQIDARACVMVVRENTVDIEAVLKNHVSENAQMIS
jgi:hypothetical protein